MLHVVQFDEFDLSHSVEFLVCLYKFDFRRKLLLQPSLRTFNRLDTFSAVWLTLFCIKLPNYSRQWSECKEVKQNGRPYSSRSNRVFSELSSRLIRKDSKVRLDLIYIIINVMSKREFLLAMFSGRRQKAFMIGGDCC
jgi:hypothetical protein